VATGNGTWARWACGFGIVILAGILTSLGACAMADRAVLAAHESTIQSLEKRLENMDAKLDRLLERSR
jgi:hypothetical protein